MMQAKILPEKVQDLLGLAALRLPEPLLLRIVGGRRITIDGLTLDLQAQVLLRLIEAEGVPPINTIPVSQGRALYRARAGALSGPRREMEKTVDRAIPGPDGPINLRIYVPEPVPVSQPVLVFYHGGGWVIGDLETHDPVCRKLAADVGCIVVAVDYRLAPENKFPAAVDDALAAYRWVIDHAAEFGGDVSRIAVAGDSAGGNLAAVVSTLSRDRGWSLPLLQVLLYPVTDLRMQSRSHELFSKGFFLTHELMLWYRDHYLSTEQEASRPLRVTASHRQLVRVTACVHSDRRVRPASGRSTRVRRSIAGKRGACNAPVLRGTDTRIRFVHRRNIRCSSRTGGGRREPAARVQLSVRASRSAVARGCRRRDVPYRPGRSFRNNRECGHDGPPRPIACCESPALRSRASRRRACPTAAAPA